MGTPDQIAKAEHLINEVLAEVLLGHLLLHFICCALMSCNAFRQLKFGTLCLLASICYLTLVLIYWIW